MFAQSGESKRSVKIVQFRVVGPNELIPASLALPEGQYWVEVLNGIIRRPLEVQVQSESGERKTKEVTLQDHKGQWREPVDLKEGKYTVAIVGFPKLISTIIVTKAK